MAETIFEPIEIFLTNWRFRFKWNDFRSFRLNLKNRFESEIWKPAEIYLGVNFTWTWWFWFKADTFRSWSQAVRGLIGYGCGAVRKADTSTLRGRRFESHHQQSFTSTGAEKENKESDFIRFFRRGSILPKSLKPNAWSRQNLE